MCFNFFIQEGPEKISVFDLISRTTAALEAYNRHLGQKKFSHADFFVLCLGLLEEEKSKARDFAIVAKGGQLPGQRREFRLRDESIRKLGKQLADDVITVDQFLNGIVFNDICKNRMNFDLPNESDSAESDSETNEPSHSEGGVVKGNACSICYASPSDVVLNCGHYICCLTCFETQKAMYEQKKIDFRLNLLDTEPVFLCPLCKAVITQHMHIPKIFN